jgi:RNA recognition motif-containing protein
MAKKLYVGNLSYKMNDKDLEDAFSKVGPVVSASIVMDRETGRSRGFGFVEMEDAAADEAIRTMHETELDGRKLIVNEARPKEDRPRSGGMGGRRF